MFHISNQSSHGKCTTRNIIKSVVFNLIKDPAEEPLYNSFTINAIFVTFEASQSTATFYWQFTLSFLICWNDAVKENPDKHLATSWYMGDAQGARGGGVADTRVGVAVGAVGGDREIGAALENRSTWQWVIITL